jgi:hypothetical protein
MMCLVLGALVGIFCLSAPQECSWSYSLLFVLNKVTRVGGLRLLAALFSRIYEVPATKYDLGGLGTYSHGVVHNARGLEAFPWGVIAFGLWRMS